MSWQGSTRRQRLPKDWPAIRRRILQRDPTCQLRYGGCTVTSTEVDHRTRGDDHRDTNLQGVCAPCHKHKTALEVAELNRRRPQPRRPAEQHPGIVAPPGAHPSPR